jgi:hypothetical protein
MYEFRMMWYYYLHNKLLWSCKISMVTLNIECFFNCHTSGGSCFSSVLLAESEGRLLGKPDKATFC